MICQRLEKSVTCAVFLEPKKPLITASVYVTILREKRRPQEDPPSSRIGYVYEAIKAHALFKLQRNLGSGGREVEKL